MWPSLGFKIILLYPTVDPLRVIQPWFSNHSTLPYTLYVWPSLVFKIIPPYPEPFTCDPALVLKSFHSTPTPFTCDQALVSKSFHSSPHPLHLDFFHNTGCHVAVFVQDYFLTVGSYKYIYTGNRTIKSHHTFFVWYPIYFPIGKLKKWLVLCCVTSGITMRL